MPAIEAAIDTSRNGLLKVAAAGVVTGVLTPLSQPLIDKIAGSPGDLRIALLALPFAILVFILVRRHGANPWWAALAAVFVTMAAFVCAVNAAIWTDGQIHSDSKPLRNMLAGFVGGFTGSAIMALGLCLLPAGPRDAAAWLPMLVFGTLAGALLAQATETVSLEVLGFQRSADVLVMLIVGGPGRLYGGLVGAAVYMVARDQFSGLNPQYWYFWIGLLLIAVVMIVPRGILGGLARLMRYAKVKP